MKYALALIALISLVSFAGGEFATGCADLFQISGYNMFRFNIYGQDGANPSSTFRAWNYTSLKPKLTDDVYANASFFFRSFGSDAGKLDLADLFISMDLIPELSLQGGKFKIPFGWAFTRPGGSMHFADRAIVASTDYFTNYGGRDVGALLHGQFDMIGIDLAYTNGTHGDTDADTLVNKQFTARLNVEAAEWLTITAATAMIGAPEIIVESDTTESWSATGLDFYAVANYPLSENATLNFVGEYMMLGYAGVDVEGQDENGGTDINAMLGVKFGIDGGTLTAIQPAVRYETLDPSEAVAEGADGAEDKLDCIDFCVNFFLGDKNTFQVGGRNHSFESDDIDGYTDMYVNWRMNF